MGAIGRNLLYYFGNFVAALYYQLIEDDERWGDEWKNRPIEETGVWKHQNDRVMKRIDHYYKDWKHNGNPIPWLKVCGNAFIAWVRENYPEEYMIPEED